ncbi:MAG TPA: zinc ribbon domain-containing protein [Candidatus Binatia bacterium]|nr:zinc ribbon domain-containing protein [Candidatus Binatia bacterium]
MFCDQCGAPLQAGQAFCSRCGKQVTGAVTVMSAMPLRRPRVQSHIQILGILWLALSAFNAVGGLAILVAQHLFLSKLNLPPFLVPLLGAIGWIVLLKAAAGFAAGFGLIQHEPWARTLALVLAFISLFTNIPFGTALGVYTMWVLMPAESEQEYARLAEARAA